MSSFVAERGNRSGCCQGFAGDRPRQGAAARDSPAMFMQKQCALMRGRQGGPVSTPTPARNDRDMRATIGS
jgi:hypothetical protein